MSKILDFFTFLSSTLKSFFEHVADFFQYIVDFLSNIFDIVTDFFLDKIQSVWSWITDFYYGVMQDLTASVPDLSGTWESSFGHVKPYLYVADQWLNVTFAINLFFYYIAFLVVFISIKMILKLIPTIG